ncbi:hypothetical protein F5B17DRAFT_445654 [Nemania serpens]|nr:hypothetical protein F5B17DRAFT_445654 [Nemania serpens]
MPSSKKPHPKPTRHQPRRSTRAINKTDEIEVKAITMSRSLAGGVHKNEGKSRGTTQRKRKKLQNALIKRVDTRNIQDALVEQAHLLGLDRVSSPASPTSPGQLRSRGQARGSTKKGKRYMDDIVGADDHPEDGLQRGRRWIPDFQHRTKPVHKPHGVPYSLWMAYTHLDDYMYRYSLSAAEVEALPLLEDVHEYQDSDGRTPKPITPPGYEFDDHLELVPIEG